MFNISESEPEKPRGAWQFKLFVILGKAKFTTFCKGLYYPAGSMNLYLTLSNEPTKPEKCNMTSKKFAKTINFVFVIESS